MKQLQDNHVNITCLTTYKALPVSERSCLVWFWLTPWYKLPQALPFDRKVSQWDQCSAFLKKEFPIQYVVRNLQEYTPFKQFCQWKYNFDMELGHEIKCFFRPRNSDLRKCIPKTWKCESQIIQDVLETLFLRFYLPHKLENWKNFEISDHHKEINEANKNWAKLAQEADEIYLWITEERKAQRELIELEWKNIDLHSETSYDKVYGALDLKEKKLDDKNTKALNWIVKNRFIFD